MDWYVMDVPRCVHICCSMPYDAHKVSRTLGSQSSVCGINVPTARPIRSPLVWYALLLWASINPDT